MCTTHEWAFLKLHIEDTSYGLLVTRDCKLVMLQPVVTVEGGMPLSLGELAIVVVFLGAVLPKPVNQFVGDHLWGTVVEHEQGFRAQFAYPKNLYLPLKMLPITLAKIQSRLQALTLYGSDIFVIGNGETISLWDKDSGYSPAGAIT